MAAIITIRICETKARPPLRPANIGSEGQTGSLAKSANLCYVGSVRLDKQRAHNILYVITGNTVLVLRVFHHSANWIDLL
jgi:plasmid stabilization system protein ParE